MAIIAPTQPGTESIGSPSFVSPEARVSRAGAQLEAMRTTQMAGQAISGTLNLVKDEIIKTKAHRARHQFQQDLSDGRMALNNALTEEQAVAAQQQIQDAYDKQMEESGPYAGEIFEAEQFPRLLSFGEQAQVRGKELRIESRKEIIRQNAEVVSQGDDADDIQAHLQLTQDAFQDDFPQPVIDELNYKQARELATTQIQNRVNASSVPELDEMVFQLQEAEGPLDAHFSLFNAVEREEMAEKIFTQRNALDKFQETQDNAIWRADVDLALSSGIVTEAMQPVLFKKMQEITGQNDAKVFDFTGRLGITAIDHLAPIETSLTTGSATLGYAPDGGDGTFTTNTWLQLRRKWFQENLRSQQDAELAASAQRWMSSHEDGTPPKKEEDKAYENYLDTYIRVRGLDPNFLSNTPDQVQRVLTEYAERGPLPSKYREMLEGMIWQDDASLFLKGMAGVTAFINSQGYRHYSPFSDGVADIAERFQALRNAGHNDVNAAESIINERMEKEPSAEPVLSHLSNLIRGETDGQLSTPQEFVDEVLMPGAASFSAWPALGQGFWKGSYQWLQDFHRNTGSSVGNRLLHDDGIFQWGESSFGPIDGPANRLYKNRWKGVADTPFTELLTEGPTWFMTPWLDHEDAYQYFQQTYEDRELLRDNYNAFPVYPPSYRNAVATEMIRLAANHPTWEMAEIKRSAFRRAANQGRWGVTYMGEDGAPIAMRFAPEDQGGWSGRTRLDASQYMRVQLAEDVSELQGYWVDPSHVALGRNPIVVNGRMAYPVMEKIPNDVGSFTWRPLFTGQGEPLRWDPIAGLKDENGFEIAPQETPVPREGFQLSPADEARMVLDLVSAQGLDAKTGEQELEKRGLSFQALHDLERGKLTSEELDRIARDMGVAGGLDEIISREMRAGIPRHSVRNIQSGVLGEEIE